MPRLPSMLRRAAALPLPVLLLATAPGLAAQEAGRTSDAVNVFLDCQTWGCDFDHFRREIGFVNWVRDRQDAALHILVTGESTAAGGRRLTLAFLGRGRFEGRDAELTYTSEPAAPDDEVREGLARTIRMGLIPYVQGTPAAERIRIEYDEPGAEEGAGEAATPEDDPWDFWVFTNSVRGFFRGESTNSSRDFSSSFSARRITEDWKLRFSTSGSWYRSEFDIGDETIKSSRRSVEGNALVARSMGPHWTLGGEATGRISSFYNEDLALSLHPAVEYNLFPYSESTRRELTFRYAAGVRHFRWDEETIFGETAETRFNHVLTASLDLNQPWGSASFSLDGAQYFHDLDKWRASIFGNLNVRLFRGLSVDFFGRYAEIHDQIFIPARGATEEEILLRQRQLETNYTYFFSVGLRYTWGSIYNNIVNPRFDGAGGGIIIM